MWKHIDVKGRYLSLLNGRLNARQSVLTVGYLVYLRPCLAARLRKRIASFGWWLIHNSAITGIFRESPVRTLSWQIIIPVNNNNSYGKYHACTTPFLPFRFAQCRLIVYHWKKVLKTKPTRHTKFISKCESFFNTKYKSYCITKRDSYWNVWRLFQSAKEQTSMPALVQPSVRRKNKKKSFL